MGAAGLGGDEWRLLPGGLTAGDGADAAVLADPSTAWAQKIAVHALAAVAVSLAHVLAIGAARWVISRLAGGFYAPLGPLGDWPYELRKDLLVCTSRDRQRSMWRGG